MIVGSGSGCGWARSRLALQGCDVRTRRSRRPTPEKKKRIDSMNAHSDVGCGSRFDAPVTRWTDMPGWFRWRDAQQEAVTPSAVTAFRRSRLLSGTQPVFTGRTGLPGGKRHHPHRGRHLPRQWTRGSARHRPRTGPRCCMAEEPWRAVASQRDCVRLHRHGALLISSSVAASVLFQDDSLTMGPHRCAPRLRQCLVGHCGVGSESRQRRLAVRRRLRRPPMAGRRWGGG